MAKHATACGETVAVFNVPRSRGPSGLQGLPSSKPRPESPELDSNSPVPKCILPGIFLRFRLEHDSILILVDSTQFGCFCW